MTPRQAGIALALGVLVIGSACSSTADPVETVPAPLLTAVPSLDPATVPATRPPATRTPPAPTLPPPSTVIDTQPTLDRFIPTIPISEGRLALDLEFVDGTTATVSWPATLDLVSRGLIPYGWAFIAGGTARNFFIRPGTVEDTLSRLGTTELLTEYPGANGQSIGLWRPLADDVDYLGFQFGNWTVLVYEYRSALQMSDEHRRVWASNFHGEQTATGFLRLSADRPLELVYAGDYPDPLRITMRGEDGEVRLVPGPCAPGPVEASGHSPGFVGWCVDSADMVVEASGPPEFQQLVQAGIAVEGVVIAEPPPPPEEEEEEEEE